MDDDSVARQVIGDAVAVVEKELQQPAHFKRMMVMGVVMLRRRMRDAQVVALAMHLGLENETDGIMTVVMVMRYDSMHKDDSHCQRDESNGAHTLYVSQTIH